MRTVERRFTDEQIMAEVTHAPKSADEIFRAIEGVSWERNLGKGMRRRRRHVAMVLTKRAERGEITRLELDGCIRFWRRRR